MNIKLCMQLIVLLFVSTNVQALTKYSNVSPNFGSTIARLKLTPVNPMSVPPQLTSGSATDSTVNTHIVHLPDRTLAGELKADFTLDNCMSQSTDQLDASLIVYMATDGTFGNTGLSSCKPIDTLTRAQEVIEQQLNGEKRNVEVRIAPGTYQDQTVVWSFTMRDYTITFRPLEEGTRPVFDGTKTINATWFMLTHNGGEETNIVIEGLHVQNYGQAISLYSGNRLDPQASNSHNVIRNNIFKDIGDYNTSAIGLQNSKSNLIESNYFRRIHRYEKCKDNEGKDTKCKDTENRVPENCRGLHVIYIAHFSSYNIVQGNVFEDTCNGSTVRVRDASNGNRIEDNTFIRASIGSYFEDWYCDPSRGLRTDKNTNGCTKSRPDPNNADSSDRVLSPECPSKGNVFSNNRLAGGYLGMQIDPSEQYEGSVAEECEAVPEEDRVLSYDNKPEPLYLSSLAEPILPPLEVATAWVFPSASGAFADRVTTRLNGEFPDSAHWVVGDFDGDGLDDVAVIRNQVGKSAVRVFPSNGNGISLSALFDQVLPTSFSKKHRWRAGDFDGDGRDDLLQIYDRSGESALQTYSSLGSSFEKTAFMRTGAHFSNRYHWEVGNFNGDNYDDLVLVYNHRGKSSTFTYTSTGSTFVQTNFLRMGATFSETDLWRVGDFDGDDRDDLVLLYQNGGKTSTFIYSSTGRSFVETGFQRTGAYFSESNRWQVGDMDNDGLDDLVLVYKSNGKASTFTFSSTGSSFEQTNFQRLGAGFWDSQIWIAGDFSGDLADDLVLIYGYN